MDFFTDDQRLLQETIRDFALNEVAPIADEIDEEERFPLETVDKMFKLGLMGIPFSPEYGGAGMDYVSYAIAVEELSKVCVSTGITLAAHISLGAGPIYYFGNDEQKKKYLPGLTQGGKLASFGLTEANAGSDSGATQTTAVLEGDQWVINGSKMFDRARPRSRVHQRSRAATRPSPRRERAARSHAPRRAPRGARPAHAPRRAASPRAPDSHRIRARGSGGGRAPSQSPSRPSERSFRS